MKTKLQITLLFCLPFLGNATTFMVTNSNNNGAGSFRQAVIDANISSGVDNILFASSTNGNPIVLTSGTIIINEGVIIIGNGIGNTSLNGGSIILTISPNINVIINEISFSNFSDSGISRPFSSSSSCDLKINKCKFEGNGTGSGIQYAVIDGSITVDSCMFSNVQNGTQIENCTNATLRYNYATNCTGGTAGLAIYDTYNSGNTIVTNNTVVNCSNGLYVGIGITGTISNNTTYNNNQNGISIGLPNSGISTCIISNNTSANNIVGIEISEQMGDASNLIVQNCILWNNISIDFYISSMDMSGGNPTFTNNVGSSILSSYGPLTFYSTSDPLLDILGTQNNGGLLPTIKINIGSSAINAGIASNAPLKDQRSFLRNGATDIGAFEFGGIDCSSPSTGTHTRTACNSYSWIDGNTYTTNNNSATHYIVSSASNTCDSLITLNLTIYNSNAGSQNVTACNSYLWTANGTTYTTGGIYTALLTNMYGCDSTATLNLTINNSNVGSQNLTACNSYLWTANGTTYTTGGTYSALLTNMYGCDSTATLNLTIHNSNAVSQNVTACNSYLWTANGTTYSTGGTYTALLTNMNGCDSTATLNLTIHNSNAGSQNVTACNSYLWTANGTNYTTGGTYTSLLTNMNGCDSTATLNLTINNSNSGSQNVTACNSYLWTANGTNYTTGGTYTAILTNMNGCDSTATLNLTINNSNAGSQNVTACNAYTWIANGTTYTTGGTYTALLTNMNGCDSTATLNLTIHNSNSGSQNVTACNSYLWTANGTTYTTGGIYTALLTNMYGCDSTATLNLTIHNSNSGSETITSCDSYFWSANGTTYTAGGIYAVVLTNMNGCDSTATLNLTINTVDNSINTIGDISLEANTSSAQYQWLDCDDSYSAILNETNQLFVASSNGNYAVEVSENGCVDTSACLLIYSVGMNEINTASVLIYPNPTFDFVTVQVGANTVHTIQLLDTWGRIVKIVNVNSNEVELDLQKMERGVYYLKLIADNSTMIEKVVKE